MYSVCNYYVGFELSQKREVLSSLKRKAAEQPLSVTQNLLSEVLAVSTSEANQTLPTIESLARVVQRSRAKESGSAQHSEAKTSEEFLLPSTCSISVPNTRIALARLTICLRLPNTLAMRLILSNVFCM